MRAELTQEKQNSQFIPLCSPFLVQGKAYLQATIEYSRKKNLIIGALIIIDNLNCTFLKKQDDSFLKEKSAFQNRKNIKKKI